MKAGADRIDFAIVLALAISSLLLLAQVFRLAQFPGDRVRQLITESDTGAGPSKTVTFLGSSLLSEQASTRTPGKEGIFIPWKMAEPIYLKYSLFEPDEGIEQRRLSLLGIDEAEKTELDAILCQFYQELRDYERENARRIELEDGSTVVEVEYGESLRDRMRDQRQRQMRKVLGESRTQILLDLLTADWFLRIPDEPISLEVILDSPSVGPGLAHLVVHDPSHEKVWGAPTKKEYLEPTDHVNRGSRLRRRFDHLIDFHSLLRGLSESGELDNSE